jgi:hypothetical protein
VAFHLSNQRQQVWMRWFFLAMRIFLFTAILIITTGGVARLLDGPGPHCWVNIGG